MQGIGKMRRIVWVNGWPWIFILVSTIPTRSLPQLTHRNQEGLATIVVAVGAYWFIQNYPDTATFLSDKERRFIRARLASDSDATHDEHFTWANVVEGLKDPKCWLYGLGFHTVSLPLYTFSLFLVCYLKFIDFSASVSWP